MTTTVKEGTYIPDASGKEQMRQPSPLFENGNSLVKLCDLPDNMLTYVVTGESLYVVATQWGDHKYVGRNAREELIAALSARPAITQHQEKWTRWDGVKEQGEYWWWNEDPDSAPVPVTIMWSGGGGNYFATMGQLGWNRPQDVEEMGGLWQLIPLPPQPRDVDESSK